MVAPVRPERGDPPDAEYGPAPEDTRLGQRSGMHSERNVVAVAKPGPMGTGTKRGAFALASRLRCGATSRPTSRRSRQRPLRRSRSCEGEASLDDLLSSERMTFARTYVSNISPRLYGSRLRERSRMPLSETTLWVEGQTHGDPVRPSPCRRDRETCPHVQADGGVEGVRWPNGRPSSSKWNGAATLA